MNYNSSIVSIRHVLMLPIMFEHKRMKIGPDWNVIFTGLFSTLMRNIDSSCSCWKNLYILICGIFAMVMSWLCLHFSFLLLINN